jgi:hypothetical protein
MTHAGHRAYKKVIRTDPMILNRPHDPRIEILERENPRPMAEDSSLKRLKHLMRF